MNDPVPVPSLLQRRPIPPALTDPADIEVASRLYPRNDLVVCREVNLGMVGGIALPDSAAEGHVNRVLAVGPEVKDLYPGDEVHIVGRKGIEWAFLPGEKDIFALKQVNIPIVEVRRRKGQEGLGGKRSVLDSRVPEPPRKA